MTHYHVCVWIDHREAKIIGVGTAGSDSTMVRSNDAVRHIHRKADHVGSGHVKVDAQFLEEVSAILGSAKAILVTGPGQAKTELVAHLKSRHPDVAERIWGVEAMDHPSDAEFSAAARKYFRAEDRMHG